MEKHLQETNRAASEKIRSLRRELETEFGIFARAAARLLGPLLLWASRREEKRLARGKTYEPRTIIERRNWASA